MSKPEETDVPKLNRAGAFAALADMGADRAVVEFSGGNDEGGPDAVTAFKGEEVIRTLPTWWQAEDPERHLVALTDALSAPVYEVYGTFAGDFDVSGEVIWDVEAKTVQMIRDERSHYEHSEDFV